MAVSRRAAAYKHVGPIERTNLPSILRSINSTISTGTRDFGRVFIDFFHYYSIILIIIRSSLLLSSGEWRRDETVISPRRINTTIKKREKKKIIKGRKAEREQAFRLINKLHRTIMLLPRDKYKQYDFHTCIIYHLG